MPGKHQPDGAEPVFDSAFWNHWGDGLAELAGYDLTFPRYGHPRRGVAVTIFVTETFSNSLRVKADPGRHPAADQFPVMKLNLIEDFQTGIYDYNVMASRFVALEPVNDRPAGSLTKVSFSSQEWCGHVYHQLLFDPASIRSARHSYFDGEADDSGEVPYPEGGITGDALHHWARGMAYPVLRPGESRTVPYLPSLQTARLNHQQLQWSKATLSRSANSEEITVPAGTFRVQRLSAKPEQGDEFVFFVETEPPHRIIRWESSGDERAALLGVKRLKYWQMNGPGQEAALAELGLKPGP